MFYVLSDDIDEAKKLLKGKMKSKFYIAYPGTGRKYYPGKKLNVIKLSIQRLLNLYRLRNSFQYCI